ncbi:MAG: 50S ribosomal protein L29 [Candidatus Adiutrix sp.]|nr:50S ribosomal protein L29 [Candidatus Adiutrix sp.]
MKTKEFKELRQISPEELTRREGELRAELFNLQMQRGTSQLENPKRIRNVKRDVARIQTVIRENKNRETTSVSPSEG